MNRKNLGRREFLKLGCLLGLASLSACTPLNKMTVVEPKESTKVDYETTSNGYFHVFSREGEETGVYIEEDLYKKLSRGKKSWEDVKIPGFGGLYIQAGQGRATAIWNNLRNGGGYIPVYESQTKSGKKVYNPVDGFYVSEPTIRNLCYKDTGEQPYDGRFVKIPGTNLEARCVIFDGVESKNGGSNDGSGGSSGGGGGGQGGGGGDSGGRG